MAKEKFLIVAVHTHDDCFTRFSESENRQAISDGTMDQSDPYAWIEASFELVLVRHREATHMCSFTPSARQTWLENVFVGIPNEAWEDEADPDALERENGGESTSYGTYRDEYDPRFICETFTIDTMKDLDAPMRKPAMPSLSSRNDAQLNRIEAYTEALWARAEEAAFEMQANGLAHAPILSTLAFRAWEKECRDRVRERSLSHPFL